MVPEFIAHAQAAHPSGSYQLGSMEGLDVANHPIAGILAWGSLIHLPPQDLDAVLAEFRRVMAPAGTLVLGLFVGDEVAAFDYKVVTAYRWPVDEFPSGWREPASQKLSACSGPAKAPIGHTQPSRQSRLKGELSRRASVHSHFGTSGCRHARSVTFRDEHFAADVRTVGPMACATASPAGHHHGRMDQSIVLTFGEHRGWCMYPPVDPYGDGYVAHIRVQLMDDGLRAETTATIDGSPTGGASDLAGFVHRISRTTGRAGRTRGCGERSRTR
jgi:hypothetical protein